ncbi:MAG: Type II secretion system protein [Candidatus Curtissbacteria bacterium GW2011_GWA1_40_9]|uniref:Type II secretion system protein n=1 Tax=Candidatus Curtissbacteria bacterium GW2011_GWA1_40_9 TaxID=1618408 RepID=A0A0G0TTY6_9BACT|nr:MAG: Type II secretion system protein [Candidatus Curtissbacteria bacterium GW2011_GWA1_40_9]
MLYRYLAKDQDGKPVTGDVESLDEASLVKILQQENLIPINITKRGGGTGSISISFGGGVPYDELVGFTRQLSTMVSAGLPLTDSLVILQKQTRNAHFGKILSQIVADVEGGLALSKAMGQHPKVFSVVYIRLIEAGETGGVLDKVLMKLADSLEKEKEFKSKTKGAFVYPAIVVVVMIIVVAVMMIFVIPKLTMLYEEIGTDLPLMTRVMIGVSDFMVGFWWLVLIIVAGSIFGFRFFAKTPQGSDLVSKMVLSLPVWGKMRKTIILAEFTRTLGLLIGTGIPIITALKVVRDILANSTYRDGIDFAMKRVERGSPLHVPMAQNPAFPPIIAQMMRVGEETGKMDEVLGRLAVYFEQESENMVRNLTTAMEPIILVILGVGVGVLVLSIIMPIYNLTAQF